MVRISAFKNYDAGFHIFEDEVEAKKKTGVRRVYYRKVHARGVDRNVKTAIAMEMYVPSDPDAWPPRDVQ